MFPQVSDSNNGVAVSKILESFIFSCKLFRVPRQKVSSVILVIIFQAVVDVNGSWHIRLDFNVANLAIFCLLKLWHAYLIVLNLRLKNAIGHYLQHDANSEEDDAEDHEGNGRA